MTKYFFSTFSNHRLKALRIEPYTQAEAERAAGMGSYIAPKVLKGQTQLDRNEMDQSDDVWGRINLSEVWLAYSESLLIRITAKWDLFLN